VRRVHSIEAESYRILRELVDLSCFGPLGRAVAERVIHASADLEYAESMAVNEAALEKGLEALRRGAPIVTDVGMVAAGITARKVHCYVSDARTRELSEELNITRSAAGFRLAAQEVGTGAVWVVGNAPTALFELLDLQTSSPRSSSGSRLGSSAPPSQRRSCCRSGLPAITNRGPKGGSAVAAAALNALIYYEED
jgi:precorrin-8X/cobalt-precorrin-8 methylmutase